MFALKKYTCLICHEDVRHPCFLNLNCDCVYECHYKCFNNWYKIKNECIICHETTNGKPFWRKLRRRKKRQRNRTPPRRVLTTEEIEDNNWLPRGNQLITILVLMVRLKTS